MSAAWLSANWPAPPGVRAISTFRTGGASHGTYASLNLGSHVGDDAAAVEKNRRRLQGDAQLPGEPQWLAQVHGIEVLDLDHGAGSTAADGVVTRAVGRVCAILTADCLPVVFCAESAPVIGAAHAGWKGLAAGVLEATVRALAVPPAQVLAWVGPAIGPNHFEVGGEVRDLLLSADPGAEEAFRVNQRGRFMADLAALARRRLQGLGITRIYLSGECTHADPARYFSHRRDGVTGRQATLIWRDSA